MRSYFLQTFRCSRLRLYSILMTLILGMLLIYVSTKNSNVTKISDFASRSWIIPDMTSIDASTSATPGNWAIFIPNGHRDMTRCAACYYENYQDVLPMVNEWIYKAQPNPQYSRSLKKLATLLFVIKHGAAEILLTSDLRSINRSMSRLIIDNQPDGAAGLEYSGQQLITDSFPFHHKVKIAGENHCHSYRLRKRMSPFLTAGVRCKSVSETIDNKRTSVLVDPHAPPVFASSPKFSVTHFSDAFFAYDGFWALFVTVFSAGTRTSHWSLWAQRMLQEINGQMALTSLECPPTARSTLVNATPDMKTNSMHTFVSNWQCGHEPSFYDCAILLATNLSNANFIQRDEVDLLKIWLKGLFKSGYPEPKRHFLTAPEVNYYPGCVIHSPALTLPPSNMISKQKLFPNIYPVCEKLTRRQEVVDPFAEYVITKPSKVQDVALVVIFFGASFYSNIRFLYDMHGKHFPYMIFCGPDAYLFEKFYKEFQTPLTYIEVQYNHGFLAHDCISRAMRMNYDVSGYIEISDDAVLNTWTLGELPRDKFWFQKDLLIASLHQEKIIDFAIGGTVPWWPWSSEDKKWGKKGMANVWKRFENILASSNDETKTTTQIVSSFLETLQKNSGNSENFFYSAADVFYVPNKFRLEWSWLSDIFVSNNVFLEIAVPTLMNGLDVTSNIFRMDGHYLWYKNRINYQMCYKNSHHFLHPWKMGWINKPHDAKFFCYQVLPNIVTDLTGKR